MFLAVLALSQDFDRLIRDLESTDTKIVEQAEQSLIAAGRRAIPDLEKATRNTTRARGIIREIARNERRAEAKRLFSPEFLQEASSVPDWVTSSDPRDWRAMIDGFSKLRWPSAEARDAVHLLRFYWDGDLRDGAVEASLYALVDRFGIRLPDFLEARRRAGSERTALAAREPDEDASWIRLLPESISKLVYRLSSEEPDLRRSAVRGLALANARDRIQSILPLLADEEEGVRLAAIRAVGKIGRPEDAGRIRPFLKGDLESRRAALEALSLLGDRDSMAEMEKALGALDPNLRRAAAIALLRMGRPNWDLLLEDPRNPEQSWAMNRLLGSDLFDKSRTIEMKAWEYHGTVHDLCLTWSRETGRKLDSDLEERVDVYLLPGSTLADALRQVVDRFRVAVMQDDVIRIVTAYEAEEVWAGRRK